MLTENGVFHISKPIPRSFVLIPQHSCQVVYHRPPKLPGAGSKRDKKKKKYLVGIKFCCATNAVIKNVKKQEKKSIFFPKYFKQNRHLKKYRFLVNIRYIFRFRRFFPSF